ncbi:MAG TPA: PEGA domain-containing protein [Terriglobales bacterium]|nr:PEGA domain-containing protein [Terriglobales bacterium]
MFPCWPILIRKRLTVLCVVFLLSAAVLAADSPWQQARIVEVKKTVDTRTSTWIVNTPIQSEETVCVIRIHWKDKILQGIYTLDKSQPEPPPEWVKNAPVRAQIVGDRMFLKGPNRQDYKLRVVSAKNAPMLDPWTQQEVTAEKAAALAEEPDHSMIGFDDTAKTPAKPAKAEAPAPTSEAPPSPPPAPEPPTGMVSISSVPYLAEVFVDGESMGYTPAKLKLAPGKHAFRCEKAGYKPWSKDITVTAGSELTMDATLAR